MKYLTLCGLISEPTPVVWSPPKKVLGFLEVVEHSFEEIWPCISNNICNMVHIPNFETISLKTAK